MIWQTKIPDLDFKNYVFRFAEIIIIIIIIIIVIVYLYPSRSLKAELQGWSVTITEDNTIQRQPNR